MMILRLQELQTQEDENHLGPNKTLQHLPQVEATQTSNISADQRDKTEGQDVGEDKDRKDGDAESSRPVLKAGSKPFAQKNGGSGSGSSGGGGGSSCSTRMLPHSVDQASNDPASRGTQDRLGGVKRPAGKENGRNAKQKLNLERTSNQPISSSSWSEMSSMVIGSDYCLSPLSPAMEQRLILQYLQPLGEYQEVRRSQPKLCLLLFWLFGQAFG